MSVPNLTDRAMPHAQPKKVLLISYHFAPAGSTGGIRALKFTKYLRDFGWEPLVLSSRSGFDFDVRQDPALLEQLPQGIQITRAWSLELLNWFWARRKRQTRRPEGQANASLSMPDTPPGARPSRMRRLKDGLLALLSWPDRFAGWIPFAVARGWVMIPRAQIDILVVTNPPQSSLWVGYLLSILTARPLVIDYRDPWLYHSRFKRWLERLCLNRATRVLCTSEAIHTHYRTSFPDLNPDKLVVLPNGFDPADQVLETPAKVKGARTLRFVHAGHLYGATGVQEFLEALNALVREHPERGRETEVLFIGARPEVEAFAALEEAGIARHIQRLPRAACLTRVQQADVLCAFLPDTYARAGCVPSKVFDAMLFRKPLLSVMADGATQDIIRQTGLGEAMAPEDRPALRKALEKFYNLFQQDSLHQMIDAARIACYNRKHLTGQLAVILEEGLN